MGCNSCKNKNNVIKTDGDDKIKVYGVPIFILCVFALILVLPVIFIGGVILLFNTMVLNKSTNIAPSLTFMFNYFKNGDVDEPIEIINDDSEYELLNVNE